MRAELRGRTLAAHGRRCLGNAWEGRGRELIWQRFRYSELTRFESVAAERRAARASSPLRARWHRGRVPTQGAVGAGRVLTPSAPARRSALDELRASDGRFGRDCSNRERAVMLSAVGRLLPADRGSHANGPGRDGWFHPAPLAAAAIVTGVGDRRRYSSSYKSPATTAASGSAQRRCCCGRPKLATPADADLELLVLAVA